jgi:hypothetical protein
MRIPGRITSSAVTSPPSQGSLNSNAAGQQLVRSLLLVCAISSALPGCTLLGRKMRECDGFDVPLSVFVGPSRKELRSRVLSTGVDETFPFVAETSADSMIIVGFTPLGTKSFTLTRSADDVEVDNVLGAALKVSPRNVMADVLAMSLPSACATAADGEAPSNFDSWRVTDLCSNNLPLKRTITRAAAKAGETPQVELEVEYRPEAIIVRQKQCKYVAAYVLQVSQPIPGVDVKKTHEDEAAEKAEAAAGVTPAPGTAATPSPAAPAPATTAPRTTAPATTEPATGASPAGPPAAAPAAPAPPPTQPGATAPPPPASTNPAAPVQPAVPSGPVLVPAI